MATLMKMKTCLHAAAITILATNFVVDSASIMDGVLATDVNVTFSKDKMVRNRRSMVIFFFSYLAFRPAGVAALFVMN